MSEEEKEKRSRFVASEDDVRIVTSSKDDVPEDDVSEDDDE